MHPFHDYNVFNLEQITAHTSYILDKRKERRETSNVVTVLFIFFTNSPKGHHWLSLPLTIYKDNTIPMAKFSALHTALHKNKAMEFTSDTE